MAEQTEFLVRVVRLGAIDKHPNADSLDITDVDGYPCLIKKGSFSPGDLAVYVPVDAMVPTDRPEFAFLKKDGKTRHRIKAIRLRGIFSMGLLVPAPPDSREGQDVQEALGIQKYIPESELRLEAHNDRISRARLGRKAGGLKLPVYGLDAARKYLGMLPEGTAVVITEKIHGSNARFCFHRGRLWVGSHKVMRGCSRHRITEALNQLRLKLMSFLGIGHRAHTLQVAGDVWWQTAEALGLKEKLAARPDFVLYGEIYGQSVQDLTYDSPEGRKFRAFDVFDLKGNRFLDFPEFQAFCQQLGVETVPVLYEGVWTPGVWADFKKLADSGVSTLAPAGGKPHLIEGVVVKPRQEIQDARIGRVALKYVGENYLLRGV